MAVMLAWLSWRETELSESTWSLMRDCAAQRSRYPGQESSGPGWRTFFAPTRDSENCLHLPGGGDWLLLDRAAETAAPAAFGSDSHLLDGTPSAAIGFDQRRRQLRLLRDPLGQRPLVYARVAGGIIAGSGEQLLRAHPQISDDFDEDYLAAFFTAFPPPHEATVYRQIRSLPAGTQLHIDASGEKRQRSAISPSEEWHGRSDMLLVERFGELLQGAVARSVQARNRVGLSLSAGIDSSTVAAALEPSQALAVTYSFPSWPQIDERALVESSSKHLGLAQHSFEADHLQPLHPQLHRPVNPDTPLASIYREIKEGAYAQFANAGAEVWLDGAFSDHLSAPADDWLYSAFRHHRWAALRSEAAFRWNSPGHWWADRGVRRMARRLLRLVPTPPATLQWLQPKPRQRAEDRWRAELALYSDFPRPAQAMTCLSAYAMSVASGEQYYAQRHGMEHRSPFRDLQLTRFMLGLPDDVLLRCGEHKWLLRQWLKERLPAAIHRRAKSSDLTPFLKQSVHQHRARWQALAGTASEVASSVLTPTVLTEADAESRLLPLWLIASFGLWMTNSKL